MKRFLTPENLAIFLILIAVLSRLIPHPGNFTPVLAIALFSGFLFENKLKALLIPAAALFLSNAVLGFYAVVWWVMAIVILIAAIGFLMKRRHSPGWVFGFSVGGSLIFFLATNFAVWALGNTYPDGPMYPFTFAGLMEAYVAGLPFYKYTLASTLIYSGALFGGHYYLTKTIHGPSASHV